MPSTLPFGLVAALGTFAAAASNAERCIVLDLVAAVREFTQSLASMPHSCARYVPVVMVPRPWGGAGMSPRPLILGSGCWPRSDGMEPVSDPDPRPVDRVSLVDGACCCVGEAVISEQLNDQRARNLARIEHRLPCPLWLAATAYLSAGFDDYE